MSGKTIDQIEEMSAKIERYAGKEVCQKTMQGKDEITDAPYQEKNALWMKDVINRLDTLTDKETRVKIMTACGQNCHRLNSQNTEDAKKRRKSFASEEEFLRGEMNPPPDTGFRCKRVGDILHYYYTPREFGKGMRCYCSLVGKLPEGVNLSPTYCQCSRAFVQAYWEGALGRQVKVDLGATALTGAKECEFLIHL